MPDPGSRIKLAEMKLHPWMDHPDSGPTPSKADHSSAMSGQSIIMSSYHHYSIPKIDA